MQSSHVGVNGLCARARTVVLRGGGNAEGNHLIVHGFAGVENKCLHLRVMGMDLLQRRRRTGTHSDVPANQG